MTEAGQGEADFGQEAAAHLDGLYSYAMSLNQAAAEDLVEQTYLRATQAFGQLPPDSNLKNWLYAIARNIWMNQLRHTRAGSHFSEIEDEQEAGAPLPSANNPHIDGNKVEGVRTAVESLPRSYREVIVLREFEGLSYQEIAGILHCPAGTVMSRLDRARDRLRLILNAFRVNVSLPPLEARNP